MKINREILRENPERIKVNGKLYKWEVDARSVGCVYEDISDGRMKYFGIDFDNKTVISNDEDIIKRSEEIINRLYGDTHTSLVITLIKYGKMSNTIPITKMRASLVLADRSYDIGGKLYISYWNELEVIRKYKEKIDYMIGKLGYKDIDVYIQHKGGKMDEFMSYEGVFHYGDRNYVNKRSMYGDIEDKLHMIKTGIPHMYKKYMDKFK